jgi:hypothetical protein
MSEQCVVYVALHDEGTAVWRPVMAEPLGSSLFRLVGPVPEDEVWEFPPGTIVRCEVRNFNSGAALIAVERTDTATATNPRIDSHDPNE